jgi:hypothetical protein
MPGPYENEAREFAGQVGAFILTFQERADKFNVLMEVGDFQGVGGTGSSREAAFKDAIDKAGEFDWTLAAQR